MKIFPVGRGANNYINEPSREEYIKAIDKYLELEKTNGFPRIDIQFTLKKTKEFTISKEEIYFISTSLNITNLGLLSLSPWAYDGLGNPNSNYIVGDLKTNKLSRIYNRHSYDELYKRLQEKI